VGGSALTLLFNPVVPSRSAEEGRVLWLCLLLCGVRWRRAVEVGRASVLGEMRAAMRTSTAPVVGVTLHRGGVTGAYEHRRGLRSVESDNVGRYVDPDRYDGVLMGFGLFKGYVTACVVGRATGGNRYVRAGRARVWDAPYRRRYLAPPPHLHAPAHRHAQTQTHSVSYSPPAPLAPLKAIPDRHPS
jgi:hypothetical protein